jgi:hypothetical protein
MTENMITVALIVGDPGREDLQLNEGSLAAAAKMTGVHGAVTHRRWDAGRRRGRGPGTGSPRPGHGGP